MTQSNAIAISTPALLVQPGPRRGRRWILPVVGLIAAGVYANSMLNGFAFDDTAIVRDNISVLDLRWTRIWVENYWAQKNGMQPDALYRPLTIWSYLANQAMAPGAAWAFHLVNVLLHALVSVLVTMFGWRLLGDRKIAAVAGLLFAVHPLHTEAVANTVGRAELLATCWSLLALLVYLPAAPMGSETQPARRSGWHGLLVAACFFAGMLCKETPATLLPAFVLIDLWRWAQWPKEGRLTLFTWLRRQFVRYYVPLGTAFAVYMGMRINACGFMTNTRTIHPVVNLLVEASPAERIVTPFALFAKYLTLTFWPVHLSADYSAPSILPTANVLRPDAALGILVCILAVTAAWRMWKSTPRVALLTGLFFLSYFLVSNVIRIGTIFGERLFYWPSVFVLLMVAWAGVRMYELAVGENPRLAEALAELRARPAGNANRSQGTRVPVSQAGGWFRDRRVIRGAAVSALAAAIVAMSYRTYVRNTDWKDDITLAIATGRDNPSSAKACSWAGAVLVLAQNPGYPELGRDLLIRAVTLYPDLVIGNWDLAKYYGRKNDLGNSLIYMARAVRSDAGTHDSRVAVKGITEDLRRAAPESYMPVLEKYQRENPDKPEAYFALAVALHGQGKLKEAESAALQALTVAQKQADDHPDQAHEAMRGSYHEAAAELAMIKLEEGSVEDAVAIYYKYMLKMQHSVDARCAYAELLLKLDHAKYAENFDKAELHLGEADQLEKGNPEVRKVRGEVAQARAQWAHSHQQSASALPHDDALQTPGQRDQPGAGAAGEGGVAP